MSVPAVPPDRHDVSGESFDSPTGEAEPARNAAGTLPRAPRGRLICLTGYDVGLIYPFERLPAMIGRASSADLCLTDPEVSRRHARVVRGESGYVIEDVASRNGVIVNDERVQQRALQVGDRIRVGGTLLVYTVHDDLELRVQQLQKLDALSTMATALAHDFKNIFSILLCNVDLLEPTSSPAPIASDAERAECMADIRKAIARGGDIVQQLIHFGRREVPAEAVRLDLGSLVDEAVSLTERTLHGVTLECSVHGPLWVRGRAGDLHQVMLNLILNARDAMPKGGRITITGRELQLARTEALSLHVAVAGRFVELVITDTGTGMDAPTLARIFEPYFTTKPVGKGTGLGLSTAYGIIRNLGGNILVTSKPGEGASFRVLVPALAPSRTHR